MLVSFAKKHLQAETGDWQVLGQIAFQEHFPIDGVAQDEHGASSDASLCRMSLISHAFLYPESKVIYRDTLCHAKAMSAESEITSYSTVS